jgi:hypothetical protein
MDSSWRFQASGHFDHDGQEDILWRNVSGDLAIWFMKEGALVKQHSPAPGTLEPAGRWSVQRTGDFDGDGLDDILWRRTNGLAALWFKADPLGQVFLGYNNVPAPVDNAWQVKGVGHFDPDGFADILWRHTDGQVAIWNMHGGTRIGEGYPGGKDPGQQWDIKHLGDFNQIGGARSDILWRHQDGRLAIWFEGDNNKAGAPSYQNGGQPVPLAWQTQGLADFNGDFNDDILWRDEGGQVAIWFMEGATFKGDVYPGKPGNDWRIKGILRNWETIY